MRRRALGPGAAIDAWLEAQRPPELRDEDTGGEPSDEELEELLAGRSARIAGSLVPAE